MSTKTMAAYIAKRRQRQVVGTPQTVKARKDEVFNNAGGAVFAVSKWDRLYRFLILGSDGGTYYTSEKKLTVENAKNVEACIKEDGLSTVDIIVEISKSGRAPKNDPALLALALCATNAADTETRGYAMAMLPEIARTGTHLFHFMEYANAVRGWGRLLREGVANWYGRLDTDRLASQVIKYQQRDGWSHRDALRLSHPNPHDDEVRNNLYKYIVKGAEGIKQGDKMPRLVIAFEKAKTADTKTLIKLITDYDLTREMIPTEKLNNVEVWEALLQNMPATAMIRNLGKMTNLGVLNSYGNAGTLKVVETLTDEEILKKARVHPLTILVALNQYNQGKGDKGSLTWSPIPQIKNALNEAFYLAFGHLESSNKNTMLAIDISGSMTWDTARICGTSLKAREGAAAMAMVSLRTEPGAFVTAFTSGSYGKYGNSGISQVNGLKPSTRLDEVVNLVNGMTAGGTDCALPMIWALKNKIKVDTFAIYTDNETWAGQIHPFEALKKYRDGMGIAARVVVVGMASNGFTIADPKDPGMLDVVGFDTAAPQVIADFSAGRF